MASSTSEKTNSVLTHRQIADQLGVSRQLVGFALRGEGRMSDAIRQRILDVASSSGYDQYSNGAARSMAARRHGKKMKMGVLAVLFPPSFEGRPLSSVPFFMPFFEGLESETFERGLDLLLCPLRTQALPRLVREGQVDGVVCLVTDRSALETLRGVDFPVVNISLVVASEDVITTPTLSVDERSGSVLATRHLTELGHRRIAYVGFSNLPSALVARESPRFDGYCDVLREMGLLLDERLVESGMGEPGIQAGAEAMRELLKRRPKDVALPFTGLVCHNDLLAMGAIYALQEAGFRVPQDVSVVGFDDVSTQYAFRPALTSISFPREQMGRRAVRLLSEQEFAMDLENAASPDKRHEIFPVELIERESTLRCNIESL